TVLGTPCYMAPEQAQGRARDIGPATDVYALGAVLYELLTGRPPFLGETPFHTLQMVVTEEPVPPSRLQPQVPPDLAAVFPRCLPKAPAGRSPSALALAEDLHRFLAGQPIEGDRPRVAEPAPRRTGVGLLAAGIAALLLLGVSVWYFTRDRK